MDRTSLFLVRRIVLLLQCLLSISFLHPLTVSAATVAYQYDARQRLIGAEYDNGGKVAFTYDAAGNRLTANEIAPSAAE